MGLLTTCFRTHFVQVSDEMSVFHDEVEIEDFEFDEDTETFYFPCPCGDRFAITKVKICSLSPAGDLFIISINT